jgi:hypothetical protein
VYGPGHPPVDEAVEQTPLYCQVGVLEREQSDQTQASGEDDRLTVLEAEGTERRSEPLVREHGFGLAHQADEGEEDADPDYLQGGASEHE